MTIKVDTMNFKQNSEQLIQLLNMHQQEKMARTFTEGKDSISLAIYMNEAYLAGLTGYITGNRMHLSLLAVIPDYRHKNYGSILVKEAEKLAISRSCRHLTVNTQDYQGLGFYQKLGFSIYGKLEDCPFDGTTKYFLNKSIEITSR
ncbi:hypothetical protein IGI37_002212 [Enterococcus sp. AZ194]|uniref:GNAT family N-acetyltransferase n=1 Tax=Enterococcus sp. AZ194 TaxID=2774629 RepID=UPI003F258649